MKTEEDVVEEEIVEELPPPQKIHFAQTKSRNSIDYMLRTTQQHQIQLSAMADRKAHILLGTSFLIFSVTISNLDQNVSWSLIILNLSSIVAAIFALVVVMPSINMHQSHDKESRWFNPLFFSFFSQMGFREYMSHMETIMADDALVYQTIIRDIYQLGFVLQNKKYKYLRYSYTIFMIGVIIAFFLFIIEAFYLR